MRTAARWIGWTLISAGAALCLAGILVLPSGGLMFALPYVFLMPGAVFLAVGALVLASARRGKAAGKSGETG